MGKKLNHIISKSSLMNIDITYQKEKIRFNLFEELSINEGKINKEIKEQPSYQGFLGVLLSHLNKKAADEKQSLKRIYAKYFDLYKKKIDSNTNRAYSNDRVDSLILGKGKYIKQLELVSKINFEVEIIESCVNSFDSRKDLIQSLSANVRKTN